MKFLVPVLGIGGMILVVLYLNGSLPGFGAGAELPSGTGPDFSGAKDKTDAFIGTKPFYLAIVSAALATVGLMAWNRIGGFGRGLVLVLAAIAATVLIAR